MSLVQHIDAPATSYGRTNRVAFSNQLFSCPYKPNYGENFTADYPIQEYQYSSSPEVDFLLPSHTDIPRSLLFSQDSVCFQMMDHSLPFISEEKRNDSCVDPFLNPNILKFTDFKIQDNDVSGYMDGIPQPITDFDEDEIKMKIQELENLLLSDESLSDPDQYMSDSVEWIEPVDDLLLPISSKDSCLSNSNISCISSNKETPVLPLSSSQTFEISTPKQLLFECAGAISDGNIEEASAIISELRQMVTIQGDPSHRIAAYMVEALAARIASSGQGLYKALKCKEPPTSDRLSAMQILFEVCPYFKFGVAAANSAIIEAFKGETKVHIVDFDVNQGGQYITLLKTLYTLQGKMPHVRLTGIDDPESVQREVGSLKMIGQRLEKLGEAFGIPFQFRALASRAGDVMPSMLDCKPEEALIINFAYQLHHMPDESVSMVNERDHLLRMVKGLNPKLVTIVEQELNTNTAPFLPRFAEVYNYYSAIYESLDATLPRDSLDRVNVERHCLARDIVNVVACEGTHRIERYEVAGKWRARMMMAGFTAHPLSEKVIECVDDLQKEYCNRYTVKEELGSLGFGWEEKILVVTSAWR